jgi:hypothetical protein
VLKFFNPYIAIGVVVLLLGSTALGFRLGSRYEVAQQLEDKAIIEQAADAFDARSAERISKLRPIHTTIQSKLQETVRENTVYRDCLVDPAAQRLLDDARANRAVTAGEGVVSGTR